MSRVEIIGSPILHDHFRSIIHHRHDEVKHLLAENNKHSKLLNEWVISRSYQEEPPSREKERYKKNTKVADVVWVLKHPMRYELGVRRIIHEVKTGVFDLNETIERYRGKHYYEDEIGGFSAACSTNCPLYIWNNIETDTTLTDNDKDLIRRGAVKLIPLELLGPLLVRETGMYLK